MMKAVEAGEIETVIVFAFSRFARSVSHMLKGLEVMKRNGTNFVSLTEEAVQYGFTVVSKLKSLRKSLKLSLKPLAFSGFREKDYQHPSERRQVGWEMKRGIERILIEWNEVLPVSLLLNERSKFRAVLLGN
jgi:DNA invertase Pin-like site-specific DNA recombinase